MASIQDSQPDYKLLTYFAIWLLFGLAMLSSASTAVGQERFGDAYYFIKRQLLFGLLPGLFLFFIAQKIPLETFRRSAKLCYGIMIALLIAVFIPGVGSNLNKVDHSWIAVFGMSFQPVEFAKLGIVFFLAAQLSKLGIGLRNFQQGFLVSLGIILVPVLLVVLQPDVGSVSILLAIIFSMFLAADSKKIHILGLVLAGVAAFGLLIAIAPYRAARVTVFLHPELDPQGIGYQTTQALVAVGSGGWFGLGLGHSRQKFQFLPEVQADSIFAVVSEEMGFIIAAGVLFLLLLIAYRCITLAKNTDDPYIRLVIVGILAWFMFQSFLNIGACVGIMPLTGVPLPFVSHGGSSLMISLAAVGILINMSRYVRKS